MSYHNGSYGGMSSNEIDSIEETPISDKAILQYLPDARILTYPELKNYNNIEELLTHNKSYVIILYLQQRDSGHWASISRLNNVLYFFCSYGSNPLEPLKWASKKMRIELDEEIPYLNNLLDKTKMKILYNDCDYQNERVNIATCGRLNLMWLNFMLDDKGDLFDFYKYMKKLKTKMNMNYDEIASYFYSSKE
jgi:hypothetical protein